MGRRVIIIFAALAGLCAGTIVGLKSQRVAHHLKLRVQRMAGEHLGLHTNIAALRLELWPPGISVDEVTIRLAPGTPPVLTLHSGAVRIQPWPSASGSVVIDFLELDGLRLSATQQLWQELYAIGLAETPRTTGISSTAIDIRELYLWNTHLHVDIYDQQVRLSKVDLSMRANPTGGRLIDLSVGSAKFQAGGTPPLTAEARFSAELFGTIDRPERLLLSQGRLHVREGVVQVDGSIGLRPSTDLNVRVHGQSTLEKLAPWLPQGTPHVAGQATFDAHLTGPLTDVKTRGNLSVQGLSLDGYDVGDIDVNAVYSAARIIVESFRLQHNQLGKTTGSASLSLRAPYPFDITARVRGLSLPDLLHYTGVPDSWVRMGVQADVQMEGQLSSFHSAGVLHISTEGFRVLDQSYRAPDAATYLSVDRAELQGPFFLTASYVDVHGLRIQSGNTVLNTQGRLSFDANQGVRLQVLSDSLNLQDVGSVAGMPFRGTGSIAASLEGPYEDITISATLELTDFGLADILVGNTKGTAIFSELKLSVPRARIRRDGGEVAVQGHIDFAGPEITAAATAQMNNLPLSAILTSAGIRHSELHRLNAPLAGHVHVEGPLRSPKSQWQLTCANATLSDVSLGVLRLRGGLYDNDAIAWGSIALTPEVGRLRSHVILESNHNLKVSATLTSWSLQTLGSLLGVVELDGSINAKGELAGPLDALSGNIALSSQDATVHGLRLGSTRINANVDGGNVDIKGTTVHRRAKLAGRLRLDQGALPFSVTLDGDAILLEQLYALPFGISLATSASVFAQGDLLNGHSITATADIESLSLRWKDLVLTQPRPTQIQYIQGNLNIPEISLEGFGTSFRAAGKIWNHQALDLRLFAHSDLSEIARFLGDNRLQRGKFELAVRVEGTLQEPAWHGEGSLKEGQYLPGNLSQRISDIGAKVRLRGRSIHVSQGRGRWGGGTLTFSGAALAPSQGIPELDFKASVDSVSLRPSNEAHVNASGMLQLVGPLDDLLLKGDVRVNALQYTANFDLERLIPRRNAPPLQVPAVDPNQAIGLAVRVRAPNNMVITNNALEAELQADFMVTGTSQRIGIVGTAHPLWARARYQDNTFIVDRASIVFTDEYRIFTQFDVHARTNACGMQVSVGVQGNSDQYQVSPSAQDEHGIVDPKDVLTCLQFGLRLRDFAGHDSAGLSSSVPASSLDALWTVSGMDEKVRRYIPVDEFRLTSAWSPRSKRTTPRVVIGKELGGNLQLSYSRAIEEYDDQVVSVEYRMANNAVLQGSWNSFSEIPVGDFGLDLRLHWEFR